MDLQKVEESIMNSEGLELKPYLCPNKKLTIGYGTNLENGISKNEAQFLLRNRLLDTKLELEDKLPVFKKLDDVRRNVILEMAYNMGVPSLLKFKNTIAFLKKSDFDSASKEMLMSKWHYDFIKYAPNTPVEQLRSSKLSKVMKEGRY